MTVQTTQQETPPQDTTSQQLDLVLAQAVGAVDALAASTPAVRAGWLRAVARAVSEHSEELTALAGAETHLPSGRLTGEVTRTCVQLELFADVLE